MSKDNFQWTRERVEELIWERYGEPATRAIIDDFESSQTQSKPEKERIEVLDIQYTGHSFEFTTNRSFNFEKFHAIKQAIEQVLNDDVFDIARINAQLGKLKAMEDAFNAGRDMKGNWIHKDFQDYKSKLK